MDVPDGLAAHPGLQRQQRQRVRLGGDAIQTSRAGLTTDEFATTPATGVLHVRLAWGLLAWAGKNSRPQQVDWTGKVALSEGTARLDMTTFLEKGDSASAGEANEVKWNSHTVPHFDGVIATVTPGSNSASVVISTPPFSKSFSIAELAATPEQRFAVDALGHEFSISTVPDEDASCSGFVVGFVRTDDAGAHFKGLRLSNVGDRLGKLRFDAKDGVISAEVVDANGEVIDSGAGTLDAMAKTFTIAPGKGTVSGRYADASYSSRGRFQATARCP